MIPLGGYVKFFGDRNVFSQAEQEELLKEYNKEDQKKLFVVKPIYQRSLIVAAGPFANFLLAILIFTLFICLLVKILPQLKLMKYKKILLLS
jgi:Predicted membrane-associated Zn-dependent proteases 1